MRVKHTSLYVLCDIGTFLRKWRPKGVFKPEFFNARFDEEWRTVEKCEEIKRVWTKCSKLEETARPVHWDSSQCLYVFRDKVFLFFYGEGTCLWPTSGEGQKSLSVPVHS